MGIINTLRNAKNFIRGVLSEPDGTPSSTRTLMFMFSFFSMHLIWRVFYHIFRIADTTQLTIWLSNMPLLITTLMGLIALPYTINKGAGAITDTFSGLANMMAQAKQMQVSTNLEGKLSDILKKNGTPTPTPTAPTGQVGTSGPKG